MYRQLTAPSLLVAAIALIAGCQASSPAAPQPSTGPSARRRSRDTTGDLVVRLEVRLLDEHLEFLGGRCGPNTVLAECMPRLHSAVRSVLVRRVQGMVLKPLELVTVLVGSNPTPSAFLFGNIL